MGSPALRWPTRIQLAAVPILRTVLWRARDQDDSRASQQPARQGIYLPEMHGCRRRLCSLGSRRSAPCWLPVRSGRSHRVSASSWAFSSPTLFHPASRCRAALSSASQSGCKVRILPESSQQSGHCGSSSPESTSAVLAPADTQTCPPQSVHSRTLLGVLIASYPTAGQTSRPARFRCRRCLLTSVPLMISTKSTADGIRTHENRPSARRRQAG